MMGTFVLCLVIILLRPLLCPRKKWIGIPNPKLTCRLLPRTYQKKFSTAADALVLSAVLRRPHPRQSNLIFPIVFPDPEETVETLICIRCPARRRPRLMPVKMRHAFA